MLNNLISALNTYRDVCPNGKVDTYKDVLFFSDLTDPLDSKGLDVYNDIYYDDDEFSGCWAINLYY